MKIVQCKRRVAVIKKAKGESEARLIYSISSRSQPADPLKVLVLE